MRNIDVNLNKRKIERAALIRKSLRGCRKFFEFHARYLEASSAADTQMMEWLREIYYRDVMPGAGEYEDATIHSRH